VASHPQQPIITLTTDFGVDDVFVGVMKGVILGINPAARIVDITHAVPAHAVEVGALLLRLAAPYFPQGTVHVAVVDPGVGTMRRAVAAETAAGIFVGPDNGVLAPAAERAGVTRVIDCTERRYQLAAGGPTFHGRDLFAPVAAHLSAGVPLDRVGRPGTALTPLALPTVQRQQTDGITRILGEVIYVDIFGNLFTNISAADIEAFPRHRLSVSIADIVLRGLGASYSAVPEGELVALLNSWGLLEIAQRNGSALERAGAGRGAPVAVWLTEEKASPTNSS
jgi:S-adenosylmethionine hydrolase